MKRMIFAAAAALACACTPPQQPEAPGGGSPTLPIADAAGNRMEALTESSGRWCTGDGAWCVVLDGANARVVHDGADIPLPAFSPEQRAGVWPAIVRQGRNDESVLIGLTFAESAMYSGGGADFTRVTLYRATPGSTATPAVLTAPLSSNITIRACFDEDDVRTRREACVDEYTFGAALSLDAENASGPARLVLSTSATSYPGARSRDRDATTEAPLQESDLQAASDPTCSYRRVLTFNGERYAYDTPPPDCANYLEP